MKNIYCLLVLLGLYSCQSKDIVIEKNNFSIVVPGEESSAVLKAVDALALDFTKVMGTDTNPVSKVINKDRINIVVVNEETTNAGSFPARLKPLEGFESHEIVVDKASNTIYLHGKDKRGTIYAIYSFSELFLEVPPLWYFCAWQPQSKERIIISSSYHYQKKTPQVKYRAWFPNDTDMFTPWKKLSADNNERYLETMLRLKLNTIELDASVGYPGIMTDLANLVTDYGIIITSHHHSALNNSLSKWPVYWERIRGMKAPKLLLANEDKLIEFWRYNIETVCKNNIENLWLLAFRGMGDRPFWATFEDAPTDEKERGEVINRMLNIQLNLIREISGDQTPYARITFYDEMSDLLALGYLNPPKGENMIWTYVAARRDHYPNVDIVNFNKENKVKLGYYMNLQFTSTGSHLAQAEGPWKMEQNYRYVNNKAPLYFSVVNAGNLREHLFELCANAEMMWDMNEYNSNEFVLNFCKQYFGETHAKTIAKLYQDYYYAYWQQKKPDMEGIDRQYIFHDMRHARAIEHIAERFNKYDSNPLREIGYERMKGRTFRIEGNNQVDSMLAGMEQSAAKFHEVTEQCKKVYNELPFQYRQFFKDNLYSQAEFMEYLSKTLYHYVFAFKNEKDTDVCYRNLALAEENMIQARDALYSNQHGVFNSWYQGDTNGVKFNMPKIISIINQLKLQYKKD